MADARQRPIFIGGTGRSGSTIVGHLLDHHPEVTLSRPMEVRFISGNDGIADALAKAGSKRGRRAAEKAVERIRDRWYYRAEHVGLHTSMSQEFLERATNDYLATFDADPERATKELSTTIMNQVLDALGADRWTDTTPANARKSHVVEKIYPESRMIVVTRDGRDVASSFVHQDFGPSDIFAALMQWESRMVKAHNATHASTAGYVLTVELHDLVVRDREATVQRILRHCDLWPSAEMMQWFDDNITIESSHAGRWRRDFSESTCEAIDELYSEICGRLIDLGITVPASAD